MGRYARRSAALRAPEVDLSAVDRIVGTHGRAPHAVVPILQAIQETFRYLPAEALERVCALTEIAPAQIAGVSTFYARFRHRPMGLFCVRVCHGTACHVAGAPEITDAIRRHLEIEGDEDTDADRLFTVERVACLGCCSLAPCLTIEDMTFGRLTPRSACRAVDGFVRERLG